MTNTPPRIGEQRLTVAWERYLIICEAFGYRTGRWSLHVGRTTPGKIDPIRIKGAGKDTVPPGSRDMFGRRAVVGVLISDAVTHLHLTARVLEDVYAHQNPTT